jgi:hypothetical protein
MDFIHKTPQGKKSIVMITNGSKTMDVLLKRPYIVTHKHDW